MTDDEVTQREAVFRTEELERSTTRHLEWRCDSGAERSFAADDPAAPSGRAPRCRCGAYMAPVHRG